MTILSSFSGLQMSFPAQESFFSLFADPAKGLGGWGVSPQKSSALCLFSYLNGVVSMKCIFD